MTRHLLTLLNLNREEVLDILKEARGFKADRVRGRLSKTLKGRSLGIILERPSTRTRVSFEIAMTELGGEVLVMQGSEMQLTRGETMADTARVLSQYLHGIVYRTDAQSKLEEMAAHATIPVINGLSDLSHPCQILADLMTIAEERGGLEGVRVAYLGDGNNMANSWIEAATLLGFSLNVSTPRGFDPPGTLLETIGLGGVTRITIERDPLKAVRGVHVIATDTWFSMGQETSNLPTKRDCLKPYQVNERLLAEADPGVIVLHCLPAHRGDEITGGVLEGSRSRVFEEAANRLHVQKAVLMRFIG